MLAVSLLAILSLALLVAVVEVGLIRMSREAATA